MKKLLFLLFMTGLLVSVQAQRTEIKYYAPNSMAGSVRLLYSYGEYIGGVSSRVFVVDVPYAGNYYLSTLVNMKSEQSFKVYADKSFIGSIGAATDGWQYRSFSSGSIRLGAGKQSIRIEGTNAMVPLTDDISLTTEAPSESNIPEAVKRFLNENEVLKKKPVGVFQTVAQSGDLTNSTGNSVSKVLPNPQGEYSHAIDTAFVYSHFSVVFLSPGTYTFTTSGSTVSRSLAVFNASNFIQSSSNVNSGPGGESSVTMIVSSSAFYSILLRPTSSGASGTTNILQNGSVIVSNAVIGGKYYSMPTLRGGDMNFFTSRITGDTRIFASRFPASSIRGYNDDYFGNGGNWNWGLASRIKKNFNGIDSVQYTFVCAYSPATTGVCDIYMGCGNSNLHQLEPNNFPILT